MRKWMLFLLIMGLLFQQAGANQEAKPQTRDVTDCVQCINDCYLLFKDKRNQEACVRGCLFGCQGLPM